MKKRMLYVFIAASLLVGCGNTSSNTGEHETSNSNYSDEATETEAEPGVAESDIQDEVEPWRQAYLDYLTSDTDFINYRDNGDSLTYTLIYLDENDVPELFIDSGVEAGGQLIATYYDGKVKNQHFPRIGSQYIEKTGLVYTNTGHMDYYPLSITKLENGEFTVLGSGIAYMTDEDREKMVADENYPYTLTYEWEDEAVSEEQFNANVEKLYDLEKSKYPDNFYTYDEFLSVVETGKWFSYDHKYEFFVGDLTWAEAQQSCKDKGGYLATITCTDEAKNIASQLHEQGLDSYSFYVGYRSTEWVGDTHYSYRWVNADGSYQQIMPAMYDFWDYNWPGYDYSKQEWSFERGEQKCGLAKYNQDTNLIYIFTAPDELLSVSPQYEGKIGYICEFD